MSPERAAARERGDKQYDPGKVCKRGHASNRFVGNNDCVTCSAERASRYYEANKEKVQANSERWRQNNLDRHRENARRNGRENAEAKRVAAKEYREKQPERFRAARDAWYARNSCLVKSRAKEWAKDNQLKVRAIQAANRAARMHARLRLSDEQKAWMILIYETTPVGWEVDHIVPMRGKKVCGLHVPWNLQHLDKSSNAKKHNKFIPARLSPEQIEHVKDVLEYLSA